MKDLFNKGENTIFTCDIRMESIENTLKKYNYTCSVCNSIDNVDVYHINKKLGREIDEDVVVLCNKCASNNTR